MALPSEIVIFRPMIFSAAASVATAVAMEGDTSAAVITEEAFGEFFATKPARVLMLMQQMSGNLRRRTNDYVAVCKEIHELSGEEEGK